MRFHFSPPVVMIKKTFITASAAQQKAGNLPPDRLRLLGEDKAELEQKIDQYKG